MSPFWEKEANRLRLELGQERVVKIDSKQISRKGFDALLPLLAAKAVSPKEIQPFLEAHPIVLTDALYYYVEKLDEEKEVACVWARISKEEGKVGPTLYIMREGLRQLQIFYTKNWPKVISLNVSTCSGLPTRFDPTWFVKDWKDIKRVEKEEWAKLANANSATTLMASYTREREITLRACNLEAWPTHHCE